MSCQFLGPWLWQELLGGAGSALPVSGRNHGAQQQSSLRGNSCLAGPDGWINAERVRRMCLPSVPCAVFSFPLIPL